MNKAFEKIIEKLEERTSFLSDCTKYGNKDAEQQNKSYSTMMMYEVADLVDDLIDIVKQEAEKYKLYDTISIHTNGLEEGIRCAVCTNQIKSDTGCDGGCCVDENLVKRICDVIHKFECKPYQPKGENDENN